MKYKSLSKEVKDLEKDNIFLHQKLKSKMNEIVDIKNINSEVQHQFETSNVVTKKMKQTEDELRAIIEKLMAENTQLKSKLRRKEEEIESKNTKIKLVQLDLKNAKNVEFSLQKEIEKVKNNKEEIFQEIRIHKDEIGSLQIQNTKQKETISTLRSEVEQFKSLGSEDKYRHDKISVYEEEREKIKEQLIKLSKFEIENEIYKSPHLSSDYKLKRSKDSTSNTINNILIQMTDTDSKYGRISYPNYSKSPTSNIDFNMYPKSDDFEYLALSPDAKRQNLSMKTPNQRNQDFDEENKQLTPSNNPFEPAESDQGNNNQGNAYEQN